MRPAHEVALAGAAPSRHAASAATEIRSGRREIENILTGLKKILE
jgi:hypothetical protein